MTNAQWYYFYGLNGKQIGKYTATVSGFGPGASMSWSLQSTQVFFKGRLIKDPGGNEQMDIRGSVGKYYPYGENRGTPPADAVQFATYTGDSVSGLDYGSSRYYIPSSGRLSSPDPYQASGGPPDPGSWNRYSYVGGDPIQFNDPDGLLKLIPTDPDPEDPTPDPPGPGPVPPQTPNSSFPKCNPSGNAANEVHLSFAAAHYQDALNVAEGIVDETGVNLNIQAIADIFLDWSAHESGNGVNPANIAENNYFGWQNPRQAVNDGTVIPCGTGGKIPANTQNACFAGDVSWGEQLIYGLEQPSGKTGVSYLAAFVSALEAGGTTAQA